SFAARGGPRRELGGAGRSGAAGDAPSRRAGGLREAEGAHPRQAPWSQGARRVREEPADSARVAEAFARPYARYLYRSRLEARQGSMKLLITALLLLPQLAFGQMERGILTTSPRSGVTQSSFVAGMGDVKAQAVVIVYNGGWGTINLRQEGGQI